MELKKIILAIFFVSFVSSANAEIIKVNESPPHAAVSTYVRPKLPPDSSLIPIKG